MTRLDDALTTVVPPAGRRPGLLVAGAAGGDETAIVSIGPLPRQDCPPDRVVFEIGSVTKVFTALLLAIAVERGEARLDDSVWDHLPNDGPVPAGDAAGITLVQLATHTSGLPRLPPGFYRKALRHRHDPYAELLPGDVLAALRRTRPRRAPGYRLHYSNFGAGVLGLALAHAAGAGFETLVRDRIARPLGMADTAVTLDADQRSRQAPGTGRRGRATAPWTIVGLAGAGALRSTAADLLAFLRAQMGALPPDVPADLAAAIPATHGARAGGGRLAPAMRVGLGWMMLPVGRGKADMVWHNGGTGGYRSFVGWTPSAHTAVAVLSSNVRSVDRLGTRVLQELAPDASTA